MQQWRDYKTTNPSADLKTFLRDPRPNLGAPPRFGLGFGTLVEICCYSILPNHYHFILQQNTEKGIENFMHRLGTGYTMYFNKKYKRNGVLFQGKFKASLIQPNNFLYLSAYVNCNSEVHGIARSEVYRWCSFPEYIGKRKNGLCDSGKKIILDDFKSGEDYKKFAKENMKHFREKKIDEKLMLED
ncbi:MAG: transposase [Candidatus Moranbacteria bacterium]|nr:transposase [Candidatus Moranbacteria bacterium]